MARSRRTNIICIVIIAVMLAAAVLITYAAAGSEPSPVSMPYADRLFSTDRVHTLDIVVNESDWQELLDNAIQKEYINCNVVIDGELYRNVAIRTKGNSTLSTMVNSDSDRYSFKIEFDHYDSGKTYHGLDKLALNNIAQDNTYLKDYVSYQLMNEFDADAPLSSFVYITLNGEDWGLYLAVEGIEEAFAQRNYGSDYGNIYKPETMDMNANRGGDRQDGQNMPQGMPDMQNMPRGENGQMPQIPQDGEMPTWPQSGEMPQWPGDGEMPQMPEGGNVRQGGGMGGGFGGGFGGRSTSDVALIYTDDEYDSYSNIFDSAKFDITDSDKDRLIASLKQMNEGVNLEEVVDVDEVLRYFVVHNYLLNFDSYTGSMNHNYYLYEKDGKLSMIAWDYNLAFGSFSMGGGQRGGTSSASTATSMVNFPIDTPTSGSQLEDRPLLNVFLSNDEYLEQYHALFQEFVTEVFDSGWFEALIDNAISLISPYVEKDPTKFCTYEEFLTASEALREFCLLRAESIQGQLDGTIPATSDGQAADSSSLIDASHVDYQSMGSMSFGGGGAGNRNRENLGGGFGQNQPGEAGGRGGMQDGAQALEPPEGSNP